MEKTNASARRAFSHGPARCFPITLRRFKSHRIAATASGRTNTLETCVAMVTATGFFPSAGTTSPHAEAMTHRMLGRCPYGHMKKCVTLPPAILSM